MVKLTFSALIILVVSTAAKVIDNEILKLQNKDVVPFNPWNKIEKLDDRLWILNLSNDELNFERLFLANGAEKIIFRKVMAPTIRHYEASRSNANDDTTNHVVNDEFISFNCNLIRLKIKEMMNKLLLNTLTDPHIEFVEVPTKYDEQSLKLYFKGPYTSVIITSGQKIYQYFISPPSLLPHWFFEEHENIIQNEDGKYVVLPERVKYEFMNQFLDMLNTYFNILV